MVYMSPVARCTGVEPEILRLQLVRATSCTERGIVNPPVSLIAAYSLNFPVPSQYGQWLWSVTCAHPLEVTQESRVFPQQLLHGVFQLEPFLQPVVGLRLQPNNALYLGDRMGSTGRSTRSGLRGTWWQW